MRQPPAFPREGAKVAMLGVGLLPPEQGNPRWQSKAGGVKVVFEGNRVGGEHLGRVHCWHLQYCSSLQMCPAAVTDTGVRK